jgi:uncharacterized protein (DUF1697 family)
MALLKNGAGLVVGVGLGVGSAIVAKEVLPALKQSGRPFAKAAVKSGILFFERARESVAHLAEELEDIVAEAQAEMALEGESASNTEATTDESPPVPKVTSKRKTKKASKAKASAKRKAKART